MIDFKEIQDGGEDWESFARDFLMESGFAIETPPNRGADAGKDFLVTEQLKGQLSRYPFRWLVSCKHRAHRGRSVSETDEPNILERLQSFKADGFLGFYSTLPSSGLSNRLQQLRETQSTRDYRIFDKRLIENHLVRVGYSRLLMRYCPESYKQVKPLHRLYDAYLPLACDRCEKDMLEQLDNAGFGSLIAFVCQDQPNKNAEDKEFIKDIYWACKGEDCARVLEARNQKRYGLGEKWQDIADLAIPVVFLQWLLTSMDRVRSGQDVYADEAYKKLRYFIQAMSQKVLREMTERERSRATDLFDIPPGV